MNIDIQKMTPKINKNYKCFEGVNYKQSCQLQCVSISLTCRKKIKRHLKVPINELLEA